jgi:dienelactone hydrolase
MTERFFSPSQCHMHVMSRTPREFAWTGQEFGPWQSALRARLRELIGDEPAEKLPLEVEEVDREETDDYVRMRILFTAEECSDAPAHLLVPKAGAGPFPAVVCLQGHSPGMHISLGEARDDHERGLIDGDRDFAVQAVRHGFVALAIEQRCFGERREQAQERRMPHGCQDAVMHALMLGRTVIGERIWDVSRGIDLLQEQPEVDRDRIACLGNSGGGTVTFYAACLDERIKLAVPSCSFCTYADSIMRIEHCADNYIPGILKVAETYELAGLIAPRRLLIVAGETDDIFPIDGVQEAFGKAREIFAAVGCEDNVRLVVGPEGHRFYADLAWPVIEDMMP